MTERVGWRGANESNPKSKVTRVTKRRKAETVRGSVSKQWYPGSSVREVTTPQRVIRSYSCGCLCPRRGGRRRGTDGGSRKGAGEEERGMVVDKLVGKRVSFCRKESFSGDQVAGKLMVLSTECY